MANRTYRTTTLAAALAGAALPLMTHAATDLLANAYANAWPNNAVTAGYVAPSAAQLGAAQALFVRLLQGKTSAGVAEQARALGWELHSQAYAGGMLSVLTEAGRLHRASPGHGLYAFFSGGRHALQAPHVPTDGLTGDILLRYAGDGLPRALAWNTVPRNVADLAHLNRSYLIAFSLAFVQVYPREKIVQLHGFDAGRRRTAAAAASGAIVSAGHNRPSAQLAAAVHCMREQVEPKTRLFGADVSELGGTTNTVAQALRAMRYDLFVHVEMALPLRKRLLVDGAQRRALLNCLDAAR